MPTRFRTLAATLASLAWATLSLPAAGLPPGKSVTSLFNSTAAFPSSAGGSLDFTTDAAGFIYVAGSIAESQGAAWQAAPSNPAKLQEGSGRVEIPCFPGGPATGDVFVAKLSPDGTHFLYVKSFGGRGLDQATAIAVDSEGRAIVTGFTDSPDFPGAAGSARGKNLGRDVFVVELSPDGSQIERTTLIGGDDNDEPHDIAFDANGNIYVAGQTLSPDFPTRNSLPREPAAGGLLRSDNAAMSWVESNNGLVERRIRAIVPDPRRDSVVYAITNAGIFRSSDAGANWEAVSTALLPEVVRSVATDPVDAATLYAGTDNGVFKTNDGGANWIPLSGGLPDTARPVTHVVIDPANPLTIYLGTGGGIFKSSDGGQSWSQISRLSAATMLLVLDPRNSSTVYTSQYASGGCGFIAFPPTLTLEKSTDGGATFQSILGDLVDDQTFFKPQIENLAVNPLDSANLYLATSYGLFRTTDGGAHWLPNNDGLPGNPTDGSDFPEEVRDVILDSLNPARLYALLPFYSQTPGLAFESDDAGSSWRAIDFGDAPQRITALAVDPKDSARVYAGTSEQPGADGFVVKLSAGDRSLEYSTILGGSGADNALFVAPGEDGAVYVGGETQSDNFPLKAAGQPQRAGEDDLFVARLAPNGASLVYSTYLGGGAPDHLHGFALDRDGSVVLAGQTFSPDFPVKNGIRSKLSGSSDAFLTRISPDGASLVSSGFLGGTGDDAAGGLALGPAGEIYLTGATGSPNFPITEIGGGCGRFLFRYHVPFLTKLDAGATRIEQSLRLADSWIDRAASLGIATDAANGVFLLIDGQTVYIREPGSTDRSGRLHVAKLDLSGAAPSVTAPCVANAASLISGPVAPGEIVSIYGNGMGPEDFLAAQPGADGLLPLELDGTRVLFDGEPGPIVHIQSNQVSAIAPLSVAGKTSLLVEVERGGQRSAAARWLAAEAHPGIFTTTYDGFGPAVYNEDWSLNFWDGTPAHQGSVISVFLNGGGLTEPQVDPGGFAALDAPLARLRLPVTAAFNDIPATVEYAGTAPGRQHGVMQVNVRIPAGLKQHPGATDFRLVIGVNGHLTQAIFLLID